MAFVYQLFTPGQRWAPLESIDLAINSQAGVQAQVTLEGDQVWARSTRGQVSSRAVMQPFDPEAYQALAARYTPHVTDRDRDTALPFQRTVVFQTDDTPEAEATLIHVAVADGLWWLLGGFLADPVGQILWGWRGWRGEQSLPQHAAALLSTPGATVPAHPPALSLGDHPSLRAAPTDVVLYTLPYCTRAILYQGASEGRDLLDMRAGLGLVPFAVEVHASQWGTLTRLLHALDLGLVSEGWAIDEYTLLQVDAAGIQVYGTGQAYHAVRSADGGAHISIHAAPGCGS